MRCSTIVVLVFSLLMWGCSGSGAESNDQTPADAGDADLADGSNDADAGPTACEVQDDCSAEEICHDGACREAPECGATSQWETCVDAFEEIEEGLGRHAICDGERCRVGCLTDQDCRDDEVCSDSGDCIEFGGELTGEHPGGSERADLEAGIGEALMRFPIGVSQGGYGSRAANNDGRYVESLAASDGQMHGLYARAFLLDNGARQIMFVRLPVIFPTMPLHEAVARKLQEETGRDWRDSLVISGTHTHSGPARLWQLPVDAGISLGTFGTDEFSQQVFDWLVDSTFEAASEALDDRFEARFGWEIVEGFDEDDHISSDRWEQTPPFDDNRLLLFRIDDADGTPRAAMVSFGTHGTVHSKNYMTGDVPAGVERALEARLGETYDRFVPAFYMNQNGGTMSPRGDRHDHVEQARMEALGAEFAERALPAFEDLNTDRDIDLEATTHRFPITYETLGYEEGEWTVGGLGQGTPNDQYDFGALQCLQGEDDEDYETHADPPVEDCLPAHIINNHRSLTLFAKSQMTALRIDGLTMLTLPGEASMELGWQVLREARDRYEIDPLTSWTFGYAQDHQLYLTPTNLRGELPPFDGISTPQAPDEYPDYAFSWLQGGYEASMSVWGWKFGDFLLERAMETVGLLEGADVDLELPEAKPTEFTRLDQERFPVESSDAERVGDVVEEPPESVERLETIEVAWVGGDPGAEMPQAPRALLERRVDGDFEPVETDSRRPYDNREPVMLTRRREVDDRWEWVVRFEEMHDFPTGEYRFRIEGHYVDEEDERHAYEATTRAFEIAPLDDLDLESSADESSVEARLAYPAATALSYDETDEDPGAVTGNFRMRHPRVGPGVSPPLEVDRDITADDVTVRIEEGSTTVHELSGDDL
ncbi:MAG: neutral/alkaline non-lysosomal ceramidase N-terminal domain-containing protein, partial [Persicimonas sp.]